MKFNYKISLCLGICCAIWYNPVFAEVDPAILRELMQGLADTTSTSTTTTTTTQTPTTTTTAPAVLPACNTQKTGVQSTPLTHADTLCTVGSQTSLITSGTRPIRYAWSCTYNNNTRACSAQYTAPTEISNTQSSTQTVTSSIPSGTTNTTVTTSPTNSSTSSQVSSTTSTKKTSTESTLSPIQITHVVTDNHKATITFSAPRVSDIGKFQIQYTNTSGDTTPVSTYPKEQIEKTPGVYAWYISNIPSGTYTVQVVALDKKNTTIASTASTKKTFSITEDSSPEPPKKPEPSESTAIASSPTKNKPVPSKKTLCQSITVQDISVKRQGQKTILTWGRIPNVSAFRIYTKDIQGKLILVEETKNTTYTVHGDTDTVQYQNFVIQAVCSDASISPISGNTLVKTGLPWQILLCIACTISCIILWGHRKYRSHRIHF